MGVAGGPPECFVDVFKQPIGDRVFEDFRLFVNLIPLKAEAVMEVGL